eukprot:CAMPEP_0198288172 /NCGR_PEP_ID=MMETSP1449-20131203/6779_1 /TAXON_ID=420275 /ORGANISM="Attheya septentrionalis, Strain CCMP2084" /LENGTH=100 /DNA_ID=CAMNT_0043986285 /DNA_START=260 /DNA_END=562 /DNA_ORIENTATION=-
MSYLKTAANVAHKTTVFGLVGFWGYGMVSVGGQVVRGLSGANNDDTVVHPQAGYIQQLREKCAEEYAKYYDTGHRDWYDKDDNSFLKNVPRPNRPEKGDK